jgi:hypothetical protein
MSIRSLLLVAVLALVALSTQVSYGVVSEMM